MENHPKGVGIMMNNLDLAQTGELIRKIRKERGLRLEDLADENISPATISNIERGIPHVHVDKIRYLLNKLDLDLEQLPELITDKQEEMETMKLRLVSIESMIDCGNVDQAIDELKTFSVPDDHPYAAYISLLRGKSQVKKRKWKRAERELLNAIRIANQNPQSKSSNIAAGSYNELSIISYFNNNLEKALHLAEKGIEVFVEEGERTYYKSVLLGNKALYLEHLDRVPEALRVVEDLWDSIPEIPSIETVLSLYELRSVLLRRSGMYEEAIRYATEGIEIGRINRQTGRLFHLWTALGSVYLNMKKWNQAEIALKTALSVSENILYPNGLTTVYTQLGILYMNQKEWEEAHRALSEARDTGERTNDLRRLALAYLVSGDCHRAEGDVDKAVPHYQQALQLARKQRNKKREYAALFRLAQCVENTNQQEFRQYVENMYKVQVELSQPKGMEYEEIQ